MDALAYVTYPTVTATNASYVAEGDDILYGYGAGYFETIPDGAQVLVQLDGSKDLLEGFLPSDGAHYEDFLNNSIQAISYQGAGVDGADLDVVLFANTLTNKTHQRDEYNFISNTAFASVVTETIVGPSVDHDDDKDDNQEIDEGDTPLDPTSGFTDVADNFWGKEAIDAVVEAGLMQGTSATTFAPNATTTRAMLMTILARMDGVDTTGGATWYTKGMEWAVAESVSDGTNPEGVITREQLVTMLYRSFGSPEVSEEALTFADAAQISDWAADAMKWAVENGILTGKGNNTLDPQGNATRAELAAVLVRATAE